MKTVEERFGLDGRVAVVTGASAGLGVAFSKGLAGAGARVVLAARRLEPLKSLESELAAAGKESLAVACDVSKEEEVDQMVAAAMEKFNRSIFLSIMPVSPIKTLSRKNRLMILGG